MDYLKEFISKLHSLDRAKRASEVFKDFLGLSTCSLAQTLYKHEKLEQRYMSHMKGYTKEQADDFSQMLAFLVSALEEKHQDFLGQVYSELNIGNKHTGQFFTPYNVSKMMTEITCSDIDEKLKEQGIITLSEPCSGSGGIIIAFAETMKDKGYNYQQQLFVEAIDIDEMCFMMTYIQLTLYGIPAKVMQGDTIAWKFQQVLYTPMYFLNGFEWKLKQYSTKTRKTVIAQPEQQKPVTQLSLFQIRHDMT